MTLYKVLIRKFANIEILLRRFLNFAYKRYRRKIPRISYKFKFSNLIDTTIAIILNLWEKTIEKHPIPDVVWKPVVYQVPSYTATVVQAPPPTVQAPATVVEAPKYVPEPEPVVEQDAPVYNTVPITGGGFHFTKNWSFQPYATYAVAASAGASAGAVSKTKSKEVDIDPTEEDARRRRS